MITGEARVLTDFIARGGEKVNGILREMVEALPVAIYTTDDRGRLTYFNPAAVKLSGRVPSLGTDHWCITWKIYLPDGTHLPHDECPMAVALKGGEVPSGIECIAERPDGSRFWFTPCPAVFRDTEGRITGAINLLVDITDRKNAELEAKEHFRTIVEATPECVKIVAPDGTLLFMNSPGLEMVGASCAEAVIGKKVYDIVAPEDRDGFRQFNERICRGEKASLEFDIIGLTGIRRHMETHAAPMRHVDGTTVHLAITRDIGERRRTEIAASLFGAIVDSSDDAIISKNLSGIITSWNKGAESLFGYTAAETIGQPVTLLIPPDRQDEEPRILERLKRGERVEHFETVRRRKDGTLLDLSLTISPVKDRHGVIVGASKIARDITDRKRAEAEQQRVEHELRRAEEERAATLAELMKINTELSHARDKAQAANQSKSEFLANISHEIRTPLNGILGMTELVLDTKLTADQREDVMTLKSSGDDLLTLINDVLDFSKIEAGKLELELISFNLRDNLAQTMKAMAVSAGEKRLKLRFQIGSFVPEWVIGDSMRLRQIVLNLLSNAIKFTAKGEVTLQAAVEDHSGDELKLHFLVRDTGIGIAQEKLALIFEAFSQEDGSTTRKYGGTGLGLTISKRLVEAMGGEIWVESTVGEGSSFHFTMWVARGVVTDRPAGASELPVDISLLT